ncbi:hypothetical protein Pelo_6161 [Pelomyxa schiedti]|nr:hypothetical protein Pelo_6161 [Pelomyxa schiedti]
MSTTEPTRLDAPETTTTTSVATTPLRVTVDHKEVTVQVAEGATVGSLRSTVAESLGHTADPHQMVFYAGTALLSNAQVLSEIVIPEGGLTARMKTRQEILARLYQIQHNLRQPTSALTEDLAAELLSDLRTLVAYLETLNQTEIHHLAPVALAAPAAVLTIGGITKRIPGKVVCSGLVLNSAVAALSWYLWPSLFSEPSAAGQCISIARQLEVSAGKKNLLDTASLLQHFLFVYSYVGARK